MTVQHLSDITQALAAILSTLKRPRSADHQIYCGPQLIWASYDNGRTQWCDLPAERLRELQRYNQLRAQMAS